MEEDRAFALHQAAAAEMRCAEMAEQRDECLTDSEEALHEIDLKRDRTNAKTMLKRVRKPGTKQYCLHSSLKYSLELVN